jgi:hypothetical protein
MSLNPADMVVDDSLPKPSILGIFGKTKVTDEEESAGKPLRLAARKKVANKFEAMVKEQRNFKTGLEAKWDSLDDKEKAKEQKILDIYKSSTYLDLFNYVKEELVWWDNNIELSTRQINTRDINYDETLEKKQKALDLLLNKVQKTTDETFANDEEQKKREKLRNATIYDDILDALSAVGKSLFFIVYVIVGLRCASFATNENLHKPVPYRILIFIYTFLFVPIFGPYYLWRGIQNYIWNTPLPPYEGFFPLYPYDKSDPLTLNRRLYGYIDSPELQARIATTINKEIEAKDAAVLSKGLREQIIAEHSV